MRSPNAKASSSLWVIRTMAKAAAPVAHQRAEFLDTLRRQHGGRLVEDQHRLPRSSARKISTCCCSPSDKLAGHGIGIDADAETGAHALRTGARSRPRPRRCHQGPPSDRFSATVSVGTSMHVLKDGADAESERPAGR